MRQLRAGGVDVTDFPAQECLCLIGLGQRVHAGAATAPGRFRELDGRHAWKLTEHRARLRRHLLAVHEVTGIVIRDRDGAVERRGSRRAASDLDQPLMYIAQLCVPGACGIPIPRIVSQQVSVLPQVRATAAGVRDDGIVPVGGMRSIRWRAC